MSAMKIVGVLLLLAGVLALVYGGFNYTDTHRAEIGSVNLAVKEKDWFGIPIWAGLAAIVLGGVVLVGAGRKG